MGRTGLCPREFGEPVADGRYRLRGEGVRGEQAALGDLAVRGRDVDLAPGGDDEEGDMVARKERVVRIEAEQFGAGGYEAGSQFGVRVVAGVQAAGGRLLMGPDAVADIGRYVIIQDPTGAVVGLWQSNPGRDWPFGVAAPGRFTWAELNTRDGRAADEFFTGLFGYQAVQVSSGETDYVTYGVDNEPVLGRMVMTGHVPEGVPPHWMIYFDVDPALGTDALVARITGLGGTTHVPPFDTPYGRIAVVSDPTGAPFAVVDRSKTVSD